jgi:hypothetical protein
MAETPRIPNIEAQRTAMKKLDFLIGEWSGQASAARGPGVVIELNQTESAQFKLDGLLLMIEGIGRTKADGTLALQALGLISFDDASGKLPHARSQRWSMASNRSEAPRRRQRDELGLLAWRHQHKVDFADQR